jgi:hypothetical protein
MMPDKTALLSRNIMVEYRSALAVPNIALQGYSSVLGEKYSARLAQLSKNTSATAIEIEVTDL